MDSLNSTYTLDRNALVESNPIGYEDYQYTFETTTEFHPDPKYEPDRDASWWEVNWKKVIKWTLFAIAVLINIVLIFICPASALAMFLAGLKGALSGLVMGAIIGAIGAAINKTNILDGIVDGAIEGAVNGYTAGALCWFIGNIGNIQCFKEDTIVKTIDGDKSIQDIKVGDKVLAYDENTGKSDYKKVLSLSRNVTKQWCTVTLLVNNKKEEIVSTPGHKYYLPDNKTNRDIDEVLEHDSYKDLSFQWVSAKDLKSGDKVLLSDGSYGIIDSVVIDDLQDEEVTYNFEVEDYHTYFVGESHVCVHNANCASARRKAVREAWKEEYNNVKNGGDGIRRPWSEAEKTELLQNGKVKGYQGHHINSVKGYPSKAGDPNNIKFLTPKKHLEAHLGNFRNITSGPLIGEG